MIWALGCATGVAVADLVADECLDGHPEAFGQKLLAVSTGLVRVHLACGHRPGGRRAARIERVIGPEVHVDMRRPRQARVARPHVRPRVVRQVLGRPRRTRVVPHAVMFEQLGHPLVQDQADPEAADEPLGWSRPERAVLGGAVQLDFDGAVVGVRWSVPDRCNADAGMVVVVHPDAIDDVHPDGRIGCRRRRGTAGGDRHGRGNAPPGRWSHPDRGHCSYGGM